MGSVRSIQRYMAEGCRVLLDDGRTGRIVRIDTRFPTGNTVVSVWVRAENGGPGLARVEAEAVVGPAPAASA
jgi:hypothetical protein